MKYLQKALDLVIIFVLYYGLYTCQSLYEAQVSRSYQQSLWAVALLSLGGVTFATVAALLLFRGVVQVRLTMDGSVKLMVGLVLLILSFAHWLSFMLPFSLPVGLYLWLVEFVPYAQMLLGAWLALLLREKLAR